MAAWKEGSDIAALRFCYFANDVRQAFRFLELWQDAVIVAHDSLVFCRHGPLLQFDRISGERSYLDFKTRMGEMHHGEQGLNRMVPRGKEIILFRKDVAFITCDNKDFFGGPFIGGDAAVSLEIGDLACIDAQGVFGREKGIAFCPVRNWSLLSSVVIRNFSFNNE